MAPRPPPPRPDRRPGRPPPEDRRPLRRRTQLLLLPGEQKAADRRARRVAAIDRAKEHYGPWTVFPARMLGTEGEVQDRISFGPVEEIAQVLTKGGELAGD